MPSYLDYLTLCIAAAMGGAVNSVAGGGTLLTFPALLAAFGAAPNAAVAANATSTVALLPGSLAGMAGYRRELGQAPRWSWLLVVPSLAGGLVGATMVIVWPRAFSSLVPWLILTAALLFWLQPRIALLAGIGSGPSRATPRKIAAAIAFQTLVAVYGGYFGAGIGILMLSALAMMGLGDIHHMNGLKTLLASAINLVAAAIFIAQKQVDWSLASSMAVAAVAGGYFSARIARRLDRNLVRRIVVAIGFSLAGYYFYRQWT
ncbi:MAG TPA: sulfite exporter TauE/SafE family protein [Pirellulales bacterium]|nr:sulfite exporter TauE/SafE family protein [Pirellulales bacterium]